MRTGICGVAALIAVVALLLVAPAARAEILKIREMELAGLATVTASPWDIGSKDNLFDGDWNNIYRSASINPAVITVQFVQAQTVGAARAKFSHAETHEWTLEGADTLADLDGKTGSYIKVFGPLFAPDGVIQWHEWNATPVTRKVFRFTVQRLVGDNYVHIHELELQTPEPVEYIFIDNQWVPINVIEVSPPKAKIAVGAQKQYEAEASLSYGPDRYDVTGLVQWSSGDPAVATIAPGGLATAKKVGKTAINADHGVVHGEAILTVREPRPLDLNAGFIQRTPAYNRFTVSFDGDQHIAPGFENEQKWPAPGEVVTYTGHLFNKGDEPASAVPYRWLFDGKVVKEGLVDLPAQGAATVTYAAPWPADEVQTVDVPPGAMKLHPKQLERAVGGHRIRLEIDPFDDFAELSEHNNAVEDHIGALTFWFYMDETTYTLFSDHKGFLESYSPEDWGRMQLRGLERRLRASGCDQRLRLDNLVVVPDGTLNPGGVHEPFGTETKEADGRWGFQVGEWPESSVQTWAKIVQNPLAHELGHQIGLIDVYQYDIPTEKVLITKNGKAVSGTPLMPLLSPWNVYYGNIDVMHAGGQAIVDWTNRALMADASQHYVGRGCAAGMTRNLGLRRGFFGDYLGAVQQGEIRLKVQHAGGVPAPWMQVRVFQREPDGFVRDVPKFAGVTNGAGLWTFPKITLPEWYGGIPVNNPWSFVWGGKAYDAPNAVGANAVLVVELDDGAGAVEYHFVEVDELNVAMGEGVLDDYTVTLTTYKSRAKNALPVISFGGAPDTVFLNEGQPFQTTISATDPDGDPVTLSATPLTNSTFNPATGLFTFTPDSLQVTEHQGYSEWMAVHFRADDGRFRATKTMRFRVSDVDGFVLVSDEPALCPVDVNGDGTLNIFDFLAFVNLFNSGDAAADCDASGALNVFDFLCFVNAFNAGC